MHKISVVIPVYNRTLSLRDSIESVLLQSIKPLEIIIVDDGSCFNILTYLKNYLSHIKVITLDSNKGVSFARNIGIKASMGEYIAFLDSDDLFLPKKLEHQINYMQENSLLISHTDEYWYKNNKWINQGKSNKRYGGYILNKILDKCRISPSSLMVHASVFNTTAYFNENLRVCEDYDIFLRFALKYKIGYLEKKLIIKRNIEENSLSASIKHIESIRLDILNNFYNSYLNSLDDNIKNIIEKEIERKKIIVENGKTKNY